MEEAKHDGTHNNDDHHDHHRNPSKHIHWDNSILTDPAPHHPQPHPEMSEKEKKALKKKKKKKLKSIGKRHPEFELTYDMMLGIRYAVSLSERSVTTTHPHSSHHHSSTANTTTHPSSLPTDLKGVDLNLSSYEKTASRTNRSSAVSVSAASAPTGMQSLTASTMSHYPSSSDDSDSDLELETEFLETKVLYLEVVLYFAALTDRAY